MDEIFRGIGEAEQSTSDTSIQEVLDLAGDEKSKVEDKLLCKPIQMFHRDANIIPFHIPHKKLLEKIEYQKPQPEPLAGYSDIQEELLCTKHPVSDEPELSSIGDDWVSNEVLSTFALKFQGDGLGSGIVAAEPIFPHAKLMDVMDQTEWINKMRNAPDGSFIYMTYTVPKSSEHYSPYALSVVPFAKVDKTNFYTMSSKGVMQHVGVETIFTTLDIWEREYKLYCKLMHFRTFYRFKIWKGFKVWRKAIIRKKFRSAQKYLGNNLFILNEELRGGLLSLQTMCCNMSDNSFIDSRTLEDFLLFYFIENQMEQLETVSDKLQEFREIAKDVIANSCLGALLGKGFVPNELLVEPVKERKRGPALKGAAKKTSYIEQAAKKKFCLRLTNYIILADYMMIFLLHGLVKRSTNDLKLILEKHLQFLPPQEKIETNDLYENLEDPRPEDAPQLPLFETDVVLDIESLSIDPPLKITLDIFNQIMELWQDHCKEIKTFTTDDTYRLFTNPIINGKEEERICGWGPTLYFYLNDDKHLKTERQTVLDYFTHNYDMAQIYVNRFEFLRQFYAEDAAITEDDLRKEREVEKFRHMCKRYHEELKIIDNIIEGQAVGLLKLKMTNLKESATPEPERLIAHLKNILPWIGKNEIDKLVEESESMESTLNETPVTTQEYVKYLEYLENVNQELNDMEETLDYCKELYDIMEEFEVPVPEEDMSNYLGVSVTMASLRNLADKKLEELPKALQTFNDQMNKDISALISNVGSIKDKCMQPWLYDIESNIDEVTEFLNQLYEKLVDCQQHSLEFKGYQKQFRLEVTRFDMLDEVMADVKLRMLLWDSVTTWSKTMDEWYHAEFQGLDVDEMNLFTAKTIKNINLLEKGLPKNLIVPKLKDDVELMKNKLPVVGYLRNPSLRTRHWVQIENVLNYKFKPEDVVTLELLESLKVFSFGNELQEVSGQASSEAGLESLLRKVEESWKTLEFQIMFHKDSKDVFILGSLEEVQAVLDDSFIAITTIASSRHVGPIKPRVDEWARQLDLFSKTLDEWTACQQSWVYLEVIFSAPDIQRQLPNESKLFAQVDKSWKQIMRRVAKMPLAMEAAMESGMLHDLKRNNALLEQIMKCLESYLEVKRVAFPRFYFLSNDELLEILAQTRNPHAVQPHLRKCFDAIAKLEFAAREDELTINLPAGTEILQEVEKSKSLTGVSKSKSVVLLTTNISAMLSPEGERVGLIKGLKARGNVEDWLGKVEAAMFLSLRRLMKASLADYQHTPRTDWTQRHPSQIILAVSQIMWAQGVHSILDQSRAVQNMAKFMQTCIHNLNDLAAVIRTDLEPVTRKILIALITIDVHARDTINTMVKNKVTQSGSFDWLKVLRYYWDEGLDDCVTRMSSAHYVYGYEYLGAAGVLVITPLTDRCYLCLMGALQLDLGGAPAGPAGTGKTETTKDLAKALAIQCVVFNCSEGLDYKMMGRFFSGLAQSGAWCCFDEFNRIDIEVLSVIAQQIITIRNAKAAKLQRFMFEGREIKLIQKCAAFITMNPGYAGRTELPDNLKALFRPISMMVPDYALIAEVILYSEGFESSKILSQKMVQMYKLCSEQLSQQDHYDFGMRAVKSVLVMAGALKRSAPDRNEDVVLICALRDSNLPKFLADDALLFQGILNDLFPGVELPEQHYGKFQDAIVDVMVENQLQPEAAMIKKVIQLYETMIVRWGVMLVGPTGGGKSTVLNTLNWALTKMYMDGEEGPYYRPVHTYIMNPKAITAGELYGEVNAYTLEWRDGLMGIMMRTAVQCVDEDHQWIICDGPVDAVWIENLNTVLDDNKMLCLANSERIKLTPYVHMVFEVMDLAQASPATVSRCGMVYIDPDEVGWLPYAKSWAQRLDVIILSEEYKAYLISQFEETVRKGFHFIRKNCDYSMHQVNISKVAMMCALIESHLRVPNALDNIGEKSKVKTYLCQIFIFSYVWGLGGNLLEASREKFESFVRDQFDEHPDARLPPGADLYALYVNTTDRRLDSFIKILPTFTYNKNVPFFEMLVPTSDTVRFGHVMELLVSVDYPVIFVGDTGVGKSVVAKHVLNKLYETGHYVPVTINFSAQTSSARTQEMLELKLEKKKKTLLGAPMGKKLLLFVDDVNMPKLETYGAQPPIELLRQFLTYGGLYDRDKLFWKQIKDVIVSAACAPPGGGRNPLTPRFVRFFGMLLMPSPNEFALKAIFKAILKGFFMDFSNEIRDLAEFMVGAAVEVYMRIETDLLPTPAKSHYVFNLRDLSKCVQGVLQADAGTMRDEKSMLRLFYHECLRVFHDRLINVEDKSYFYYLMREICSRNFGTPVLELPESETVIKSEPVLIFGDFMQFGANREDRLYEEITNIKKLKSVLQDYLEDYNLMESKDLHLVFFMDAIEHCVRIARILRSERGNGLLVGVSGMGKQSLTRLASHLNAYKCFQIELSRNYDRVSFFEDIRKMYFNAGALNNNSVFLFTDNQIVQEDFLEDINNILNSGEVPNLFESDEYEKVIITTRDAAKQAGVDPGNRDGIYDFFISRVRNNLHLVLCMSPVGDAFRRRCRMFPSLVNCCTIDWFEKWPHEALLSVALTELKELGEEETVGNLSTVCVTMHESVEEMSKRFYNEMRRRFYTTPSSYLELLKLYLTMLEHKRQQVSFKRDRIANGLKKLYETNSVIQNMKDTLTAMEPILAEKSIAVDELMVTLTKEQGQADKVRTIVKGDEEVAKAKADDTQALADDAQRDLDTALPALEAATKALEALNKNDINEIKVFQKPPKLVQFVMESICLLLGAKADWASAKIVLADANFLKKLQEYDKNNITEGTLRKLKQYVDNVDFIPEKVGKVSKACKSMCMWVRAIDMYSKVFKIVEPKRKKLEAAEKELNQVMALLRDKQKQLADVEAQIAALEAKFNKTVKEKEDLEAEMDLTAARLNRAGRLNIALGDEQARWEVSVTNFGIELENSLGDVLVAGASVAYLGAFTSSYRNELVRAWVKDCKEYKIPVSDDFNLITVLADPYDIRMWNSFGLPRDTVSTENAILVTQASRWALMIDPQEQANRWIRQMEAENGLLIVKLTDANFMRVLESAIRVGKPVLLEEVGETLDPTLAPILQKQTFMQSGRLLIRLGDSDVEYDESFKFFVTTKLANPHYLPEICIQVTIVNFTVTKSGLEDQLLADVVRLERPDLETQRSELIVRINNDKTQLKNIEDKILRLLYQSEGNILDDEELIETLNESKETSAVIAARLIETEATEHKISEAREKYRIVSTRGSVLYFVIAQLADIDPMYQYSLKYFNQIFNHVIETSEKNPDLNVRLETLLREITLFMYTNVSRGLFERHKLVYSFMTCVAIYQDEGEISDAEWSFLLRGPVGAKIELPPKPNYPLITDAMWLATNFLSLTIEEFAELPDEITDVIKITLSDFHLHIRLTTSEKKSSVQWDQRLCDFDKLLLLKTLKEEKLVFAITEYVKKNLGKAFIESPQVSLQVLFQDTSNITPLIFILSTGSDPFGAFQRFAEEMGYKERIKSISLGQGQGPVAEKIIEAGLERGDWVFLQNCHLATSWMLAMERLVLRIASDPSKVHPQFRLFMSSMPSKAFPVSVLQNSVKVTNEPPKGLRANIKRAFTDMTPEFFEEQPLGQSWKFIIFGICMFHAIIQERKKFGPLGWNIIYEFNDSDREFAFNTFQMFCAEGTIPWDALEYLTGEITYGGRVTDYWDLRCLRTILDIFFSPKILKAGYKYSPSGVYFCPNYATLNEYREFIDGLPILEDPEIFGMHENANIAYQIKETQTILHTIMESQPQQSGGAEGQQTDVIVFELATGVTDRIMTKILTDDANVNLFRRDDKGRLPSLTTVLMQEVDRYNILLKLIHSSMDNLKKAIKGLVVMSEQLEEVYVAFTNNQVPKMWSAKSYNSLKSLGSWTRDLTLRLDFIKIWVRSGPPASYWLSGFYFPQGFLTGNLQTFARKYELPIDQLKFDFEIKKAMLEQENVKKVHDELEREDLQIYKGLKHPEDGAFVHGLFLDAGRWDLASSKLVDAKPGEINPLLPVVWMLPKTSMAENDPRYVSPLYKTSVRAGVLSTTGHSTNFVIAVLLPTDKPQSYWILKGTALLTQVTD